MQLSNNTNKYKFIQGICFSIISLNLLWAFFADSRFGGLFSYACILMFGFMIINFCMNISNSMKYGTFLCYVSFVLWSLVMIIAYEYAYPIHSRATFLVMTMDSYAIFFVRLFVSVIPCMVFVDIHEFKSSKTLKIIIFIILATTLFFVSRAIAINPNALRERALIEGEGYNYILLYTPAYAMTYSYALILPVFLHKSFVTDGKTRIFYVVCTVMMAYIIFVAQYATALIIAIIGIAVYLLLISSSVKRAYIILVMLLLWYIISALDGGADIFRWLANQVDGVWSQKLNDIALVLSGNSDTGSVSGRADLYRESFNSFLASPVIGKFHKISGTIGGHATAIDVLGMAGIVGFALMLLCFLTNFARFSSMKNFAESKPAIIACVTEFIILIFFKNIITSMAIFFVYFVLIKYLLKLEEV